MKRLARIESVCTMQLVNGIGWDEQASQIQLIDKDIDRLDRSRPSELTRITLTPVSASLTFRTEVQLVGMATKRAAVA
jgi:hypothetical protein